LIQGATTNHTLVGQPIGYVWGGAKTDQNVKYYIGKKLRGKIAMGAWWCYPTPSRGIGAWRNSTETKQSCHAPRSGPEVKNGSNAKDGAPERLGCGTIQEEVSQICRGCPQALHEEFSFRFILHR